MATDRFGQALHMVQGFQADEEYFHRKNPCHGRRVGHHGNRICDGRLQLGDREFPLRENHSRQGVDSANSSGKKELTPGISRGIYDLVAGNLRSYFITMIQSISFEPIAMERVWGGRRLEEFSGQNLPAEVPFGELWVVCDREEAQSRVEDGSFSGQTLHELWTNERERVFGRAYLGYPSKRFPLLLKILDASEKLSVQVHPPLHRALDLRGEPKTEVWYFLESSPNANIYAGLKKGITRAEFEELLQTGNVEPALHDIPVRTGESIFIPSGRVHAIGAGNVIIEIQQNSDTTYRVFDWNRVGLDGKPRALHIDESMASIDFEDFEPAVKKSSERIVADCPFFHVEKTSLSGPRDVRPAGRFALAVSTDHAVTCGGREFGKGRVFLVPADATSPEIAPVSGSAELLVCTLPV